MKLPLSMIRDYVTTAMDAEAIGDLLTMAGFELEGIEEVEGEPVLDIKVMSNRGDGLSVVGLTREILAKDADAKPTPIYERAVRRFEDVELPPSTDGLARIETKDCSRYAALVIEGPQSGEAPAWVRERLVKIGMRSISLLVDLTNYVMLELGQPLHAFDQDKLDEGRIVVRKARLGEKLKTLDGNEHELRPDQMMICDASRPVAAAGVMGGEESEVSASTTRLLLESASFLNTSVRRTRKQLGLSTEASYRFERSVDPEGVVSAIRRFWDLLRESLPDARLTAFEDVYPGREVPHKIRLRLGRAVKYLGITVQSEEAERYLAALGFALNATGEGEWEVTVPTWRPDVVREDDIIEEIGRVHGYERIPERLPEGPTPLGGLQGDYLRANLAREALAREGFLQTVSHSLRDLHPFDAPGARTGPRNPASPVQAWLRNSLLPSLADAATRNGGRDLHLFEWGRVFAPEQEWNSVAALSTGALVASDRKGESVPHADFYSLKGALEAAVAATALRVEFATPEQPDVRFHPARQATILADGNAVGIIGQIHPDVADACGMVEETVMFEADADGLFRVHPELKLRSISRNPAVRRDIALLIDREVPYQVIEKRISGAVGDVLERQWLFDVFTGAGIPEGKHSLGIALQLRKAGENFTDEEANQVRDRAVAALAALGGTTR
ncbi:phenylalanine--tRNA ligase subunit beta [soil metagenome]